MRVVLYVTLIASLMVNGFLYLTRNRSSDNRVVYGVVDQQLITRAETLWTQKEPRGTIESQGRYAQVIHFPNKTCVSFELRPGGLGGVPVYCFSPADDKLVEQIDDVE